MEKQHAKTLCKITNEERERLKAFRQTFKEKQKEKKISEVEASRFFVGEILIATTTYTSGLELVSITTPNGYGVFLL